MARIESRSPANSAASLAASSERSSDESAVTALTASISNLSDEQTTNHRMGAAKAALPLLNAPILLPGARLCTLQLGQGRCKLTGAICPVCRAPVVGGRSSCPTNTVTLSGGELSLDFIWGLGT